MLSGNYKNDRPGTDFKRDAATARLKSSTADDDDGAGSSGVVVVVVVLVSFTRTRVPPMLLMIFININVSFCFLNVKITTKRKIEERTDEIGNSKLTRRRPAVMYK